MLPAFQLEPQAETPLYMQIYEHISSAILRGTLARGEKLPPTRELAGSLGLNRTTVAAAYQILESEGLIRGHVGRGSFVEGAAARQRLDWESLIPPDNHAPAPAGCGGEDQLLVLATLRDAVSAGRISRHLPRSDRLARRQRRSCNWARPAATVRCGDICSKKRAQRGAAGENDEILITSGCQQAFDLIQRVLASHGETVLLEDPVYPGIAQRVSARRRARGRRAGGRSRRSTWMRWRG